MLKEDCIFCKIIKGEIPSSKVYEDDDVLAFLDIAPFNKGHTVVIPKNHFNNFLDFSDKAIPNFFKILKTIAEKIMKGLEPDGFNLIQNNFSAAGQVVEHIHFHIVPRWKNDNLHGFGPKEKVKPEELQKVLEEINKS